MTKFRTHLSSLAGAAALALSAAAAEARAETISLVYEEIVVNGTTYGVKIQAGDGSVRFINDGTSTRTLWVNTGQAKVQLLCKGRNCKTADGAPFPVPPNAPTTTLSNGQTVVQIGMLIPAVQKDTSPMTHTPYGPYAPKPKPGWKLTGATPIDDMPPAPTGAKPGLGSATSLPGAPAIKDGTSNTIFVGEHYRATRRVPSAKLKALKAK